MLASVTQSFREPIMYRYRCEGHTTWNARKNFNRVGVLGKIKRVKGYRFTSCRKNNSNQPVQHEYVLVVGENGSCRFSGLCWSYSGEGPSGLCELLKLLGIGKDMAEQVAYHSYRGQHDGTDWELKFRDGQFSYMNGNWTSYHAWYAA
jgi:hypothetical protein